MSKFSGSFYQAPEEKRRYILNYALTLSPTISPGETILSITTPILITQTFGPATISPFVISGVVIGPGATQVVFYASGGDDGTQFEVQFLANTSSGQIIEDVVQFTINTDL